MTIYFIREGEDGPIKIGTTSGDPLERLAKLRTGNPRPLRLLATMPGGPAEERALHARFASLRLEGEWFTATDRLLGFVECCSHIHGAPKSSAVPAEPTLFGLTRDHVLALHGYSRAIQAAEKLRESMLFAPGNGPIDPGTVADLVTAKFELEGLLAEGHERSEEGSATYAYRQGILFYEQTAKFAKTGPEEADELLEHHHSAIADQRLYSEIRENGNAMEDPFGSVPGEDPWGEDPPSVPEPTPAVH